MSAKQTWEHRGFRVLAGALRRLPSPAAYSLAEGLALLAHGIFGWRKRSVRERLAQVLPEVPEGERERIRRESVRNLARNVTELVRGIDRFDGEIEGRTETLDALERAREKGRGVLLVIVHSGNWDLAGVSAAGAGLPMCFIARSQKNAALYQELIRSREAGGGTVIDRDDPRLMRKLRGFLVDNGVVAILVDIRARTPGETFHFLGHDAPVANGLGLLAGISGAEVVPVFLSREGRRRQCWKPFPAMALAPGCKDRAARARVFQSCLDTLGAEVRRHPESYFWFNKRWVLEPFADESEDAAGR